MLRMTWFETEADLQKLTGLDHDALWDAGFNLDDWDWGIRVNKAIHGKPEADADGYCREPVLDFDKEGHWLLMHMQDYCVGPSYVKLGRWHYYLLHHA